MDNSEILKKLYKVSVAQQKIIRKLAQQQISIDIGMIQNLADRFFGAGKIKIHSASMIGSKFLSTYTGNMGDSKDGFEQILRRANAIPDSNGKRYTATEVSLTPATNY